MNRGFSGDKNPSDGDKPPERDRSGKGRYVGKGKGRARTPPPREPEPGRVSDAYGPGRNPEMVALEQHERRVTRSSTAKVVAAKAAEDALQAKIRGERRFNAFRTIPWSVFDVVFRFVPFSHFLMFLCTCKLFSESCDCDSPLLQAAVEAFKCSFHFVGNSAVVWEAVDNISLCGARFVLLRNIYQRYFGDGLSRDGVGRFERVILRDLFPYLRRAGRKNLGHISAFLSVWLYRSVEPFTLGPPPAWYFRVPIACLSTLRFSGIFSTFQTRRAFIEGITFSMNYYFGPELARHNILLNFLLRLTSESYRFSVIPVSSADFSFSGNMNNVGRMREGVIVMDIDVEDVRRLNEQFRMLYGDNFIDMSFDLPPSHP